MRPSSYLVARPPAGERHAFAIRLMLATGLRWSDVVRLQASDLKADGWLILACSKTGKVLRIPLGWTDPAVAQETRQRVGRLVAFSASSVGTFSRTVQRRSGVRFSTYRVKDAFACRWLDRGVSRVRLTPGPPPSRDFRRNKIRAAPAG